MKLPKYIKLEPVPNGSHPSMEYKVSVAWWGVPILAYQAMKEYDYGRAFVYAWLWVYPKVVFKTWAQYFKNTELRVESEKEEQK